MKLGETYKRFLVTKVLPIEELKCNLIELVHEPSGATVLHIANDDRENCFCLSFQTWPSSSNGAPHILEHTVLCGSTKYPVKDPFFSMTRRSLNTYMNALTAPDFTCYPAASQVEKDFYNLMEVYLDAVFHPQLKPLSFLQEGHRLEFAEPENPESPLVYKGVVFNEMKGAMASADSRLWQSITQNIMPDLPYAFNSGGDPADIPSLTFDELREFHRNYYHPSHCLFYFYGNLPLKKHLDFIDEKILHAAHKISHLNPMRSQPRFSAPKFCVDRFPATEENASSMIAYGWLTVSIAEQEEVLALSILDSILMETDASLLKHELLQSGLCATADSSLESETSDIPWIVVCKGCKKEDADALRRTLLSSLEAIADEGIEQELIDAALHQLEFSRTEITGDGFPYGLNLFMRAGLLKQQGCDAELGLMIHSLFEKLSKKTKDPAFLSDLIRKYFLNNNHFVQLVMVPDVHLNAEEQRLENEVLARIQEKLTDHQKSQILEQTKHLKAFQEEMEKQSLDCLPKVSLNDVPKEMRDFPLTKKERKNTKIYHHDAFTNRILYVDLLFDLPNISEEDLPYLSLFVSLLTEIGCGKRNYLDNLDYINAYTGGIEAYLSLNSQISNPDILVPTIGLRGKALYRNTEQLLSLLKETFSSPQFNDPERIQDLIQQEKTDLENRLTKNAMRYAISLSLSSLSRHAFIHDQWKGLKYYEMIQKLTDTKELIKRFERLKNEILCLDNLQAVFTCDQNHFQELEKNAFYGIEEISHKKGYKPWQNKTVSSSIPSQAKVLSSPVAFNSFAFRTAGYLDPDSPALLVSTDLLENVFLHRAIREMGGAYGTGATYSPTTGDLYFYSFRDPHAATTKAAFVKSLQEIADGNFDDQDLEEAKLGIIQGLDSPVSPGSRGLTAFYWLKAGKTKEMREKFRQKVLSVSKEEISQAIKKHLLPKADKGIFVSFADKNFIDRENELFKELGSSPLSIVN
ncbi:MAG TPA: insulinase family protein [Chlamydiales bacterium]|nr:insulinase family protein [Chlamydiales bacterium]